MASLKGLVEVQCPNGCAPFEARVWSLIRLDSNPELKEELLAGQLNLLSCEKCHRHFYYDQTIVVHDPRSELLAFVFPEECSAEAERWRAKMVQDYETLQRGGEKLDYAPILFFGLQDLRTLLEQEDNLIDESEIARHLTKALGLELYSVKPSVARERGIPVFLPREPNGGELRAGLVSGLQKLLKENPYLQHYDAYLKRLSSALNEPVPPPAKA
jgi:hypothetical protein